MTEWQKAILKSYPGIGLNLSISPLYFQCEWGSNPGYSIASSNISLDILAYHFYGWKSEVSVELNLTILSLDFEKTDGKTVAFYFQIRKENGMPVTDLSKAMTFILFRHAESNEFTLSKSFNLSYLGDGYYLAEFSMYSNSTLESLNEIKNYASQNMTDADFKPGYNSTMLVNLVDQVITEYNATQLVEAYSDITVGRSWIVENEDTSYVLAWIDIVRSQLLPTVRVALQDSRGIVVGAARTLTNIEEDDTGPITRSVYASPNPTAGSSFVTLTAWIDDLETGFSNIADAEYFVDIIGENGTGTHMMPTDERFDSVNEEVKAEIDVSGWALGSYTIYVHGKDEAGFWGEFNSITINVTEPLVIYVQSIDMRLRSWRSLFQRLYQAEAVVTIVDSYGNPVEGATVYGHWNGPPGNVEGITDENGKVSFLSERAWGRKTFTFTVDNVVKSGCIYNASLNVETSDTISS